MTETEMNKVLDRIKKLLALATSSNANEAALALQRAQELMAAHNVSEATVELGVLTEMEIRSIATATRVKGWELRLMQGIADAFGLELLFRRGYPYGGYIFVGPTADVQVAHYAATIFVRNLAKHRAKFTASLATKVRVNYLTGERIPLDRAQKTAEVDAFCSGWVRVALEKVTTLTRPSRHRELIHEHAMRNVDPEKKTKMQQRRGGSHESAQAGAAAAQDVSLHRPVNGSSAAPTRQLGGGHE